MLCDAGDVHGAFGRCRQTGHVDPKAGRRVATVVAYAVLVATRLGCMQLGYGDEEVIVEVDHTHGGMLLHRQFTAVECESMRERWGAGEEDLHADQVPFGIDRIRHLCV